MIGIIGAMEEEVQQLLEEIEEPERIVQAGINFWRGTLRQKMVTLAYCGIGKVNAAICTQLLITVFRVDKVIFTGVAGGIYPKIGLGDIVISSEALEHDMDVTGSGHDYGKIPRMERYIFPADPELIQLARKAGENLKFEENAPQIFVGRILSGDQYICSAEKASWLYEHFNGFCVEMEGAAVAHVCYLNNIPFVIIRSISDKADDTAEDTYKKFSRIALRNSTYMVRYILEEL